MLISNAYREENRKLHENPDYGVTGLRWAPFVEKMVQAEGYTTVLDYGCGKQTLSKSLPHIPIRLYDPAISGLDTAPEPAELVICTDVLEHIERPHLNAVLRDLRRVTTRKLLFNIATCAAKKVLSDGRNAHLIIEQHDWWKAKLELHFHILQWAVGGNHVYGEAVPRTGLKPRSWQRPKVRRPAPPQIAAMFDHIRQSAARYNDAFNQIKTIRMWEGVGDEPADMQCVANLIEDWPDPDEALLEICKMAHKAVLLAITLGDGRTAAEWRTILERRLRIAEWYDETNASIKNQIFVVGSPMIGVQGVVAVGAVSSEDRWSQIEEITKRIPRRIETAPAHERRAIVACYGPSLESTLDYMRREREETGAIVVSVSGSHDFLMKHGIVPDYHVECDPRAYKADNIEKMSPGTKYLLASCVSPVLIDKLGPDADIRLWHVSTAEHAIKLIDGMGENQNHVISGGGSVGLRSIPLMYALGYRNISVYAMDCSFADAGEKQWAGAHAGKRHNITTISCNGRVFATSPTLVSYATNFWETVQKVTDLDIRLYGDGLLQAMARYYTGVPDVAHVKAEDEAA